MGIVKDITQIGKMVIVVASLFNLNAIQQTELKNYVKLQQYEWIEKRKDDAEVEAMLKSEAQRILSK